jgi:hypothetical protein
MHRKSIEDRFWPKVNKTSECWLWTAAVSKTGYGKFGIGYRTRGAHRVAYELIVGPIPEGLTLDHLCRTPLCVNPAHLEPVPIAENIRRAFQDVTHCKRGHEYVPANTYVNANGWRSCLACRAIAALKYRLRKSTSPKIGPLFV